MRGRPVLKTFAIIVSVTIFACLAWFFGVFMHPQGQMGAILALALIGFSAVASLLVYGWIMRPGPKAQFRDKGVAGPDREWGMGLMGAAEHRRRREDPDGDDFGGRNKSGDADDMDADEAGIT